MANQILLTEQQAAEALNLKPRTLQVWRGQGIGPRYARISSRCVRYRPEDLQAWAAERLRTSTSDHRDAA